MKALERINKSGLNPIASVMTYPRTKNVYVAKDTKGKVFRLQKLHACEEGRETLSKNRRGFTNSKMVTVAHAPSLYHWLFHRCGICFEEARELVAHRRLVVDGTVVEKITDMEAQLEWDTFLGMDIQVKVPKSAMNSAASTLSRDSKDPLDADLAQVPVLQRALHRTYMLMCTDFGTSTSSDVSDPRSFVHRINRDASSILAQKFLAKDPRAESQLRALLQDSTSKIGLNVIRPAGFVSRTMTGLTLVTNDVTTMRHWNNEYVGNYGVYDIRFPMGAPDEVYRAALTDINEALAASVKKCVPLEDLKIACSAELQHLPEALRGKPDVAAALNALNRSKLEESMGKQRSHRQSPQIDDHRRILVETPLLPYRVVNRLRRNSACITTVKVGPFSLPMSLVRHQKFSMRPLSLEELVAFFAFEKKMKTNRIIYSLREFDDVTAANDEHSPMHDDE